jgi:ribosome-associated protein
MESTESRMKQNSTAKEKSLHPEASGRASQQTVVAGDDLDQRIVAAINAASEKKALNVVVLDLREIASFTDYFVIASGTNERQVQAISDEVYETLKKAGSPAARVEGYKTAEWILLDYGDFIVHVFEDKSRKFYDLERLWRESKRVDFPPDARSEGAGSLRRES